METLLDGRSEIRNRVIARVFKELGYIEQWGSGIQRIKSACLAAGLTEPRIREKGDFVDVEFYRPVPESADKLPDTAGYRRIPPDGASPQELSIIKYIDQHGSITAPQVETLLVVKERRAREILKEMADKGWLEKRGSARSTVYLRVQA